MRLHFTVLACVACLGPVKAQPAFDVASVKPAVNEVVPELSLLPGRLHASNVKIKALIAEAYQVLESQVSGPDWLQFETYNLDARSDGAATIAQSRLMLQSLLADRFHLKLRRDTKQMTAYTLSIAAGKTSKLSPADKTGCEPEPSATNPCQRIESTPTFVFTGEKVSMPVFCKLIARLLYYQVVDRTGLDGVYNWKLDLSAFAAGDMTDGIPVTVTALRDQLGLKLERTRSAIEVLVIEHIERPSAN